MRVPTVTSAPQVPGRRPAAARNGRHRRLEQDDASTDMGADVRLVQAGFGIGSKDSWHQALEDVRAAGGTPYAIPPERPITAWAASASLTGPTRYSSKNSAWGSSSTRSWC